MGQCQTQKNVLESQSRKENYFCLLGGPKILKIKGPRLAENAFPEISARKN